MGGRILEAQLKVLCRRAACTTAFYIKKTQQWLCDRSKTKTEQTSAVAARSPASVPVLS